ncbi:MAG: hypothetical protein HY290_30800 [Planctomycetia bacterium]|nr:hypothetical protein [Planctomycetia bacterium]
MSGSDHDERINRRTALARGGAAALAASSLVRTATAATGGADSKPEANENQIREYLKTMLLTRDDVDLWLKRQAFPFNKYDAELGYLHIDRDFQEGLDGAFCRYRYDKLDARRMFAHADEPCRINTYGNSFTSCEQVSDGETWQEALAAHLSEPVRNFGIGGYSVYQAYLRMVREEQKAPARCIIFNIFDDDHARNLHGWQRFKFGVNRKSPNPTVPHVRVDLAAGKITDRPNPCPKPESMYDLCDLDRVYALFRDDFYMHNKLMWAARKAKGEPVPPTDYDDQNLIKHGIFASTRIIERVNEFAKKNGKQVLYVLSYGAYTIRQFIEKGVRFDQALVDYLKETKVPFVDLMQAHADDAARFKGTPEEALKRYFIGHYNPLGNRFCAFAMKDALVRMLDPKPPAYTRPK